MTKQPRLKLPKYLDAVRNHVTQCVTPDCFATERLDVAHYSGLYADRLGKGTGSKCHDYAVARLCRSCHVKMDSYTEGNDEERAMAFIEAINRTLLVLWNTWRNSTPKPKDIDEQLDWFGDVNVSLDVMLFSRKSVTEIIDFLAEQRDYIAECGK